MFFLLFNIFLSQYVNELFPMIIDDRLKDDRPKCLLSIRLLSIRLSDSGE